MYVHTYIDYHNMNYNDRNCLERACAERVECAGEGVCEEGQFGAGVARGGGARSRWKDFHVWFVPVGCAWGG